MIREITGRHVLFALVAFFLCVTAVNAIFISYAVKSFPGQTDEKPYLRGLRYNEALAEKAVQDALQWSAEITEARLLGESGVFALTFRRADGSPVYGLVVEGVLERPAHAGEDIALAFAEGVDGVYRASHESVGAGVWDLKARATRADGARFDLAKRLVLK
jgi:nitrogen fixation protein FixH